MLIAITTAIMAILITSGVWIYIQSRKARRLQELEIKLQQQVTVSDERLKELSETRESLSKAEGINHELRGKLEVLDSSAKEQLKEKDKELTNQRNRTVELEKKVTMFEQSKDGQEREHRKTVSELQSIREHIENDRQKELVERRAAEEEKRAVELETWKCHEAYVEETLRAICRKCEVEYVGKEKFPDSKKPDNSVLICDEYIVFDAKSPKGEDLSNFNTYINTEVKAAVKYAKKKFVKNDIYLVVPTNAIHVVEQKTHDMGDYRVYVVDADSMESIVSTLKRLEDYDFADKLAPEDREQLAKILGKFRHAGKRRIQVDQAFANAMIELIEQSEELPGEWPTEVKKMEKAAGLKIPTEARGKELKLDDLKKQLTKLDKKAEIIEIAEAADH